VAEPSIFTAKEISFLRQLKKEQVEFLIVGAAAATLQGAPVVTQDVDLWFKDLSDPGIRKALVKVGGVLVPQIGNHPPTFAGSGVEIFDVVLTMHGLGTYDEEIESSLPIKLGGFTVRLLSLDRIIKSKETIGRPKDLLILPVLKDALATLKKKRSS
jgi:predicted nucleotidyltransferase